MMISEQVSELVVLSGELCAPQSLLWAALSKEGMLARLLQKGWGVVLLHGAGTRWGRQGSPAGWVKRKGAARVRGRHQLPQWLPSQASKCLGDFAWGDKEVGQWEVGIAGFRARANRKCKAVFSSPTHPCFIFFCFLPLFPPCCLLSPVFFFF